jgi:hypothetical protein
MNRFGVRSLILLVGLLLGAGAAIGQTKLNPSAADEFAAKQRSRTGQNPPDVSFTVRFADAKSKFQQGELIRLELAFASSKPDAFSIDSAGYDRSGRLDIDAYLLDPTDGVTDPLKDYFESVDWSMMGGLRGNPTLTAKPYLIQSELNEWHRFDKPGKFRLYVVSGRLIRGTNFNWERKLSLTSNLLEFEIVPATPPWATQTVLDAVKVIDGKGDQESRRAACRTLRFLNTQAAARELIQRFGFGDETCEYQYQFGLYGSPERTFIVSEMERQLDAPDHPITGAFIWTLAFSAWALTNPPPLPPYPVDDEAKQASWQLLRAQRRDAMKSLEDKYEQRLAVAVSRKVGPALAISLTTIFGNAADVPPTAEVQARLASVFFDLPPDRQASLLEYNWQRLASPAMLPVLRKVYENPPRTDWRDLRSLALRRLYELAPDEGRLLILDELRRPQPRVELSVLSMLPDQALPALEQTWAERAVDDGRNFSERAMQADLLARYGTDAVLPKLRSAFSRSVGQIECPIQTPILAYFLRTDEPFGVQMLAQAMAAREKNACFRWQLEALIHQPMSRPVEKVVLARLDDEEVEVAVEAAKTAGKFGSARAEARLWQRLTELQQQWKGREPEFQTRSGNDPFSEPRRLESALLEALATSPSWLADKESLTRMLALCISRDGRRSVTQWLEQLDTSITYFGRGGTDNFMIAQYATLTVDQLKAKLIQFPRGTAFTWSSDQSANNDKVFAEFKSFVEKYGMKLTRSD